MLILHIAVMHLQADQPCSSPAHPAAATHTPLPLNPAKTCTMSPARPCRRSHPAVLHHLRTSGERLLLLGHRSKWETVIIPDEVADVVVVLESLPYTVRRNLLPLLVASFAVVWGRTQSVLVCSVPQYH